MDKPFGWSPKSVARLAGAFEALEGITSAAGSPLGILGSLVVKGNPTATAQNLLGHEAMFRLGFASELAAVGFHVGWGLLFYFLFRPVSRTLAALSLLFMIVGAVLQAGSVALYVAPLTILRSGSGQELLATDFINLFTQAFNIYLVFFGFWCVVSGYLILRSGFMPRALGLLLMLDGVGWSLYLVPPLAAYLFGLIAVVAAFAELPLQLWLIVFGVDDQRWLRAREIGLLLAEEGHDPDGGIRAQRRAGEVLGLDL